jgi:hypothetical protein
MEPFSNSLSSPGSRVASCVGRRDLRHDLSSIQLLRIALMPK